MSKTIAFLGAGGVMGGPMSANLARSGYSVLAWNRTLERPGVFMAKSAGAKVASSIQEAIEPADVIFTCLGDVPDVEAVLGLVAEFAKPGTLIVDMSTIGPDAAQKLGVKLRNHNLRFLDAPVSGGDSGAKNGTLTIMVGGEPIDFEECKPLLEVLGKKIFLCGPVGSGQAVKLCNQALCAVHMMALCEAMQIANLQGINPILMIEVCRTGAAGSWALSNLGPKIVESDFQPGFMIKHMLKDLRLVQESVKASGQQLPGVELADRFFRVVKELDGGTGSEQGTQAMIRAYHDAQ